MPYRYGEQTGHLRGATGEFAGDNAVNRTKQQPTTTGRNADAARQHAPRDRPDPPDRGPQLSGDRSCTQGRATMRIAIVTETFLPKMDGIVRMLTEFLAHLRRQGHEALVIAPGSGPATHEGFPVRRIRGVSWRVYPGLTLTSPAPRQLTAAFREWQPDIVHLAGPVLLGTQAVLAARALRLPLAAHFQTDLANYATWHGVPFLRRAAWSYLRSVHRDRKSVV